MKHCPTTGKIKFKSAMSAGAALKSGRGKGLQRIYLCPECKEWHLTSHPGK